MHEGAYDATLRGIAKHHSASPLSDAFGYGALKDAVDKIITQHSLDHPTSSHSGGLLGSGAELVVACSDGGAPRGGATDGRDAAREWTDKAYQFARRFLRKSLTMVVASMGGAEQRKGATEQQDARRLATTHAAILNLRKHETRLVHVDFKLFGELQDAPQVLPPSLDVKPFDVLEVASAYSKLDSCAKQDVQTRFCLGAGFI